MNKKIKQLVLFVLAFAIFYFIFSGRFISLFDDNSLPDDFFVDDRAGILKGEAKEHMAMLQNAVLEDLDIEIRVVVVPKLEKDISIFTNKLFEELNVGEKTKSNQGVLVLFAVAEQKVRMEIGYGLEHIFPDAFISYIQNNHMLPYFQEGYIPQGIEGTMELVVSKSFGTVDEEIYTSDGIGGNRSGGAGANLDLTRKIDEKKLSQMQKKAYRIKYGAQPTAEKAWLTFLEINERGIKAKDLGIYDEHSKNLLHTGPSPTNASQRNFVRRWKGQKYEIRQQGDLAAVVFPYDKKKHWLSPWFFKKGPEGWQLNGEMYPDYIGYNHLNEWFFWKHDHPYGFAFTDYTFDKNGYAYRKPYVKNKGCLGFSIFREESWEVGLLIVEVDKGSPAEKIGLIPGDFIMQIDGHDMLSRDNFRRVFGYKAVGDEVSFKIYRNTIKEPVKINWYGEKIITIPSSKEAPILLDINAKMADKCPE